MSYIQYYPIFMGGRLTISIKIVQHLISGLLILLLAFAPAIAEETSAEKNEPIERCMLAAERVAGKDKRGSKVIPFPMLAWACRSLFQQADSQNHLGHPTKLFILYHNLKLCD